VTGPLILFDLDETIIDTSYCVSVPDNVFRSAIQRAQGAGALVGLNSDSPHASLVRYAERFGMEGPIISERGGMVALSPDVPPISLVPEALGFGEMREAFVDAVLRTYGADVLLVHGDVAELSTTLPQPGQLGCVAKIAVLVNGLRQCSVSYYVRCRTDGAWTSSPHRLREIHALLAAIGQSAPLWLDGDEDLNDDYGIVIVHHRATKKAGAVPWLREAFPGRVIRMIGNSVSDWMGDDGVLHAAVANASSAYLQRCITVADTPLTAGCIELLERFVP
jgi:hypothetical protein